MALTLLIVYLASVVLQYYSVYCDDCACSQKLDFLQDILQEEIMKRKLLEAKVDAFHLDKGVNTDVDSSLIARLERLENALSLHEVEGQNKGDPRDEAASLQAVMKRTLVTEKKINQKFRSDLENKTRVSSERLDNFQTNIKHNFLEFKKEITERLNAFENNNNASLREIIDENFVRYEQLRLQTTDTLTAYNRKAINQSKHLLENISVNITMNAKNIESLNLKLLQSKTGSGWLTWGTWSACSVTCGVGIRSRRRSCTSPSSGSPGRPCSGNDMEVGSCTAKTCTDGGWSSWGSWGSCSATCGGGIRSRTRTCTNPSPISLGRGCSGNNEDVDSCNSNTCSVQCDYCRRSAFTAYGSEVGFEAEVIRFDRFIIDIGGNLGMGDGRFRCAAPGVYYFAVTLTKKRHDYDLINVGIYINGESKLELFSDPDDSGSIDYGSYSVSGAGAFKLNAGDEVYIKGSSDDYPERFYDDSKSFFTGFLLEADTVAFTAYGSLEGFESDVIKFDHEIIDIGGDYMYTEGRFKCEVPGVYHFSVTLTKKRHDYDSITAYINVNGENKLCLHSDPDDNGSVDYGSYSLTGAATFSLNKGDQVYIKGSSDDYHERFIDDNKSFFTGFFIAPDTVAFTAYGSVEGFESDVIRFDNEIIDLGGDYMYTEGRFKCEVSGVYHFAVTLTKKRHDYDTISAYIVVNGVSKVQLHSDPDDSDNVDYGSYSVSGAGTFTLNTGDQVYVKGASDDYYQRFYDDNKTFFTGLLIRRN